MTKSLPFAIILLSCFFRLYHVGDARFTGDEAFFYATALDTASLRKFPVTGADVTGQDVQNPGGLVHYVHALPFLFTDEPVAGSVFVVLLNTCALILLFFVFRRLFSHFTATIVILLVSFNPHSIFFSDRLWNPNLLFPLGTVVLYFLCKAGLITSPTPSENGDNRQTASGFTYFMAVFLPVISLQFHLSGAVLIASVFALLMFNLKKINIRASLTGLLAGFALYVPYIISDASNGFRNSRALLSHIEQVSFPLSETARAAWYFINVCSTDITYYLAKAFWFPLEEWKFFADPEKAGRVASFYGAGTLHGGVSEAMVILSLLLTLSSFFYCVFLAAKKAFSGDLKNSPIFYFVITFIMTILSFMTSGKAFYMHYVILSLPVAIIPFAVLIERLMNTQSRLFIALAAAAVSLAAIPAVHRYYSLDEGRLGLSTLKPVAAEILEDSNGADFNVNISLDNTRASDYSMAVLAKYYFKKPWKDRKNAGIEYNIVDSRIAPDGREMKIVDIGMVRIFKYLKQ